MNLVTLTGPDGNHNVIINADRIDAITEDSYGTCIFMSGSDLSFRVNESSDKVKSICEHGITMDVSKLHPSPDLIKSSTTFAELNRKLKVVSEALSNIMEHENYDFGYSEAADIAEEVMKE